MIIFKIFEDVSQIIILPNNDQIYHKYIFNHSFNLFNYIDDVIKNNWWSQIITNFITKFIGIICYDLHKRDYMCSMNIYYIEYYCKFNNLIICY